ncbi:hypothetical protein Patl1_24357 [Pistacia atlantica]|uniref:Uncharacterized protein n=1 Tax=Pistacia atlantica TaxID=434234 RepID=A0ACC0ZYK2_9ROSI|nr:hypothetical protein Patl1_24357 [Pistacia atlantica]
MTSPYHKLFESPPNYSKLQAFGCLCYPWLRPYSPHKLVNRSTPCVFLGYSLTQSGYSLTQSAYLCPDPSTQKIFISRLVRFVESEFPMSNVDLHLARRDDLTCNTWLP